MRRKVKKDDDEQRRGVRDKFFFSFWVFSGYEK